MVNKNIINVKLIIIMHLWYSILQWSLNQHTNIKFEVQIYFLTKKKVQENTINVCRKFWYKIIF